MICDNLLLMINLSCSMLPQPLPLIFNGVKLKGNKRSHGYYKRTNMVHSKLMVNNNMLIQFLMNYLLYSNELKFN